MLKKVVFIVFLVAGLCVTTQAQQTFGKKNNSSTNKPSTQSNYNSPTFPNSNNDEPDSTKNREPEGIIFDNDEEADSILTGYVFSFPQTLRAVKLYKYFRPSLDPTGVECFNPVHRMDGMYFIDKGSLGQIHLSLYPFAVETITLFDIPSITAPLTLNWQKDANPIYNKYLHTKKYYQTQRPYTLLGYGSSLNKDYQIKIIHTQNIKPRWNVAFLYDLVSRDGLYTNSEVTNHILDITTNYYSKDARYQIQADISFNRLRQQENGGVQNDTTCWDYSREAGVPVNMYTAQNQWRDFNVHIHQSYNTVRQFEQIKPIFNTIYDTIILDTSIAQGEGNIYHLDIVTTHNYDIQKHDTLIGYDTIRPYKPHTYNTGVFACDIDFSRHRRIFYDSQANSWFYNFATLDSTFYYDSTAHYKLSSELYWTNDAYMDHRWQNPFIILFGVRPEYNRIQFASQTFRNSSINELSVSPFARAEFNIKKFTLSASAEEVTGSIRNGDYRLNGNIRFQTGKYSTFDFALLTEAQSPELIFYHNEGCYSWNLNGNYDKIKRQQIALQYKILKTEKDTGFLRHIETRTSAMLLSNNVWFSNMMLPTQGTKTGLLLQGTTSTHLRFSWFNIQLQEMVQYSSDNNVIRVPLFASKNSLYADIFLFHRALHLQTGFDIRYHTKYYADGWNPVVGAFYRQDDVEVGNYLVTDFWITLQIKRASIYLKASHFNAPIEQLLESTTGIKPEYFSMPHYPMEGFGLYWGVTWKFFN